MSGLSPVPRRRGIEFDTILIVRITDSDIRGRDDEYDRHRKWWRVAAARHRYITHAVAMTQLSPHLGRAQAVYRLNPVGWWRDPRGKWRFEGEPVKSSEDAVARWYLDPMTRYEFPGRGVVFYDQLPS